MYNAIVVKIDVLNPHPNADKIQLATVLGEQVIVGLDVKVNDVGIYFPVDGQLSHEFCAANSLYNHATRNLLALGEGPTGFFDKHRRVRTQKFRGQKSEGFWIPLKALEYAENFTEIAYPIGFEFTKINDHEICNKWETVATRNAHKNSPGKKVKRGETLMFPKHYETDQFRHKWEEIPEGSIIYLTEKLHGTSGRYGRIQDEQKAKSFGFKMAEKILSYFNYHRNHWTYLNGSRNVILEHSSGEGFYGSDEFRYDLVKDLKLRKGEVIFFELVGDVRAGTPIMPEVKVDKKELPEIFNQYGPVMKYRYGCKVGEHRLFVYRIVQMNEDGEGVDLAWPQVKRRCSQLGLDCVPELTVPARDWNQNMFFWRSSGKLMAKEFIESVSHGPSLLDSSHIREGVVIRIESPDGRMYSLKEKSFEFKFLEGIIKSNDNYVDNEEIA